MHIHHPFSVLPLPLHQAFPHKQAAAVYEALASSNSNGKEDSILKECRLNDVVNLVVRKALKYLVELTVGEEGARGLKRLKGTELKRLQDTRQTAVTEHNIGTQFSSQALAPMLDVAKYFPELITKDDSSSISSNEMVEIDIDGELPDEESLFQYAMEEAFGVAKKRGLEREDFADKAREIFKGGPTFEKTLNCVVPADYEPELLNSGGTGGTQYSDIDNIHAAASLACNRWCKVSEKTNQETGCLFLAIFKG
jgi:hypothetical protein